MRTNAENDEKEDVRNEFANRRFHAKIRIFARVQRETCLPHAYIDAWVCPHGNERGSKDFVRDSRFHHFSGGLADIPRSGSSSSTFLFIESPSSTLLFRDHASETTDGGRCDISIGSTFDGGNDIAIARLTDENIVCKGVKREETAEA